MHIKEGLTTEVKVGEFDFLKGPDDEDDADEEQEDGDEEMPPPRARISVQEATRLAIERTKEASLFAGALVMRHVTDAVPSCSYSGSTSASVRPRLLSLTSATRALPSLSTSSRSSRSPPPSSQLHLALQTTTPTSMYVSVALSSH